MLFGKSFKVPGELNTDPTGKLENDKHKGWLRQQDGAEGENDEEEADE